jgi:TonB-dependent starch-binding outer membrane protein SusC
MTMKKNSYKKFIPLICSFLFLLGFTDAYSQDRLITGTVVDESGATLPGATVKVKGGTGSAQTNANGVFSIKVPTGKDVLIVSFVGMQAKEITIGDNSVLKIVLGDASNKLNEVVVIGYGSVRRSDITSSISSVTEKDIKNVPVATLEQAVQGKVPGITVNSNTGQPGGGVSMLIRGVTSVNGNGPLYVIDGVFFDGNDGPSANYSAGGAGAAQVRQSPLANINMADIASIDFLKDASAQAIYGSRAANGVVIVTTKKGKTGDSKINYEVYRGYSQVQKQLDMMNLRQYAQYSNEVLQEIADVNQVTYNPIGEYRNPSVLGEGANWQNALFRNGTSEQHQLSFSGATNKASYYTSANYNQLQGVVVGSGLKRYSFRFNTEQQVKDWFKLGLNSSIARSNQTVALTNGSATPISIAVSNSPASPVYFDGDYAPSVNIGGYNFGTNQNPLALAEKRDVRIIQMNAIANVYGEIRFNKLFSFRSQLAANYGVTENNFFEPSVRSGNVDIIAISNINEQRGINTSWQLSNYLNYNQSFGKHVVNATLGQEASSWAYNQVQASRRDLNLNFQSIAAGSTVGQTTGGSKGDGAIASYFARTVYTYDNRYSLTLTGRRDGSSNFGPENKWGNFASASIGWTVTNEAFAKDLKGLDYLKIRLGAGSVGNQNSPRANAFTSGLSQQTGAFGPGSWPSNVPNPALSWESVKTYNAGVDATVLNKRLELTFDIYKKVTTGMLLQASLPGYTGIGTSWDDIQAPITNAGEMVNKGIDIGATSRNIALKNFRWSTSLTFTHYKNVLNALNSGTSALFRSATDALNAPRVVTMTGLGLPVGQFYGYVAEGIFRSEEEITNHADQGIVVNTKGTWLGDVKYRDISGPTGAPDGKIDSYDITTIGNPNPKFNFGLTNTFNYKNFDFSFFLQGRKGGDILNFTKLLTEGQYNVYNNQTANVLTDRYSTNNPNGNLPRYNQWHENNRAMSSRFVEDGSYLRIQNITLGYNLPQRLTSKVKMSSVRLYMMGQNVHTFTKYTGLDPELGSLNNDALFTNVDNGNYPNPRTYTIGANITF